MTAKNHLIHYVGTEILCNAFMRPMYHLMGAWLSLTPHLHPVPDPEKLAPT